MFCLNGNRNDKSGSQTDYTFYAYLAAMGFDRSFDNRQPQACAWNRTNIFSAMENFKQSFLICLWDANALVLNTERNPVHFVSKIDTHYSTRRGVFHCICE